MTLLPDEGPLLVAVSGEEIMRVDSISLQALTVNVRTGQERSFTIATPGLSANRLVRMQPEPLIGHLLPGKGSEFWLTYGRYNVHTGFPMDRVSAGGAHLGSIKLQIPQFPELVPIPANRSAIGNPTGHLATGIIVSAGDRILMIDTVALRCAWFDAGGF